MGVKEFLNKIRKIDLLIDCKLEQVNELRSLLCGGAIRYDKDKVQSSVDPDSMTDIVAKIIELEQKINEDIDRLIDIKTKAREMIEMLENDREKVILYKRYFDGKSFEELAVECGYSWRQVHRIHGKALVNLEKIKDVIECHNESVI